MISLEEKYNEIFNRYEKSRVLHQIVQKELIDCLLRDWAYPSGSLVRYRGRLYSILSVRVWSLSNTYVVGRCSISYTLVRANKDGKVCRPYRRCSSEPNTDELELVNPESLKEKVTNAK